MKGSTEMAANNILSIVASVVLVAVGVIIVRYRVAITKGNADAQRAINHKLAEEMVRRGTPFRAGFVGVIFVLGGVGMLLMGLLRHNW